MKILITGGAGFIGSHVAGAYIRQGHDVVVVDDLSTGSEKNVHPKATFYRADIRSADLENIFRKERFELINHHAAQMDVRRSVEDPMFDASVNISGSLNLLEIARKHGIRKCIFASTGGAIYGEQESFPADEDHPTNPLSPYGVAKLSVEKYLFFYKAVYDMEYVVLRYANIYGPRQNPHGEAGVVAIFASKMANEEQPVINGDGKQTRDFTYVADVAKANLLALEYPGCDIFNVGTGRETDINTLFHKLKLQLNSDCPEEHAAAKEGEQRRSVISSKKIGEKCGWTPTVSLDEGLKLTSEYFKRENHILS